MVIFTENKGSVTFTIRVVPRSSNSGIVGEVDGSLKVRISAPPVDGAANEEVVRLVAKSLGVGRSAVEILSGHASRLKRIRVDGVTPEQLQELAGG